MRTRERERVRKKMNRERGSEKSDIGKRERAKREKMEN
jgi:hypothetical protein